MDMFHMRMISISQGYQYHTINRFHHRKLQNHSRLQVSAPSLKMLFDFLGAAAGSPYIVFISTSGM